jgi:hypothetical protein
VIRLTLNTGSEAQVPREKVDSYSIDQLRPLLQSGGGPVPGSEFYVEIISATAGSALFHLHHSGHLVTICGVAWTDDRATDLWATLDHEYQEVLQEFPHVAINRSGGAPTCVPWMGVILLPAMWSMTPEDVCWIGDFETCFAWALLEGAGRDLLAAS